MTTNSFPVFWTVCIFTQDGKASGYKAWLNNHSNKFCMHTSMSNLFSSAAKWWLDSVSVESH